MAPRKHGENTLRWLRHSIKDGGQLLRAQRELRRAGVTLVNFWPGTRPGDSWFHRFLQRPRLRPHLAGKTVAIGSVFGRRRLLKAVHADLKIFFTGEAISRHPAYADHALPLADIALGFAEVSHPNYLRFPLWLIECFPADATPVEIAEIIAAAEAANADILRRDRHATLIASHDPNGVRSTLGDLMAGIGPVSYPGRFRRNTEEVLPPGWPAKLAYLRGFRFNICPENFQQRGYVTEKLFHAILAGCIPVYQGGANVPEPDVLEQDAILFHPGSSTSLEAQVRELTGAPDRLAAFARQPRFTPTAAAAIHARFEGLEDMIMQRLP